MKDGGKRAASGGPIGAVLFIAYIGAAVYFWMQATGFWGHIWALLKAVAWPAILIYQAMKSFGV